MDNFRLNSDYEPAHALAVLLQKTDGEIVLVRLTANQQARLKDLLLNESDGKLSTFGELTTDLLKFYFDASYEPSKQTF